MSENLGDVTKVPGTDDLVAPSAYSGVAYVDADESVADDNYVDPELKKGRGLAVAALASAQAIDNSEGGIVNIVFPLLAEAFGIEKTQLGIISSISKFARGILGPIWAMLADRFGKKKILFLVTGVWGGWTVATGFAPDFNTFLVLYSIAVLGTVASEPILNGLMGDLFARSERGKAFGTVRGIAMVAGMVLTPFIGWFGAESFRGADGIHNGWRYAMWVMGGLSILSGLLILMWVKEPKRSTTKVSEDADSGVFKLADGFRLFKIPTVSLLALMLPLVTSMVLFAFMATFWVQVNGFSVPQGALLYTVFQAGAVIGSVLGGLLADRVVKKFGHKGRIAMMQVYLLSFAAVTFVGFWDGFGWGTSPVYWVIVFLVGLIFPIGFSAVVLPMVSSVVPTQLNATGFAMLFSLVQGIITAIMTIVVGMLADSSLGFSMTIVIFVSGAYTLNALYWFVFYKVYPKDVARQRERTEMVAAGTF